MSSRRGSSGGGSRGTSLNGRVTRTKRSQRAQRRRAKAFQERYEKLCGPVETRRIDEQAGESNV